MLTVFSCRIEDSVDGLNDLHLHLWCHSLHVAIAVEICGRRGHDHVVKLSQTGSHSRVDLQLFAIRILGQIEHPLSRLKDSLDALKTALEV